MMWLKLFSNPLTKIVFDKATDHFKHKAEKVKVIRAAEIEAAKDVDITRIKSHRGDWKDEFVLILISIPILLLAWSVFSDDPDIQLKLDLFFERFNQFPMWFQALIVGAFSTILGVRGVSAFKKK